MAGMPTDMDEGGLAFNEGDIETAPEDTPLSTYQTQKQATAPTPESEQDADNEEIEALNTRIKSLEKELKTLQSLLKKQDPSQLEEQVAKLNRKISTLEANSAQKSVSTPSRKATTSVKAQPKPRSTQQSSAPDWVLRSADSNAAWISVDGSNDIQKIVVGDTLEGLGEIRSIDFDRYQGWVVTGTKATITQ
jgi:polyhydroxyalkanoate synthesis regulator phasin